MGWLCWVSSWLVHLHVDRQHTIESTEQYVLWVGSLDIDIFTQWELRRSATLVFKVWVPPLFSITTTWGAETKMWRETHHRDREFPFKAVLMQQQCTATRFTCLRVFFFFCHWGRRDLSDTQKGFIHPDIRADNSHENTEAVIFPSRTTQAVVGCLWKIRGFSKSKICCLLDRNEWISPLETSLEHGNLWHSVFSFYWVMIQIV